MKILVRAVAATLMLTFAVGCAKTDEQKSAETKQTAANAIAELKSAAASLDQMGSPRMSWPDETFVRYESLLNTLDAKSNEIEAINGQNGIYITGTYSLYDLRRIVKTNRAAMIEARAEKARYTGTSQQQTSTQPSRVEQLNVTIRETSLAIKAAGFPMASWTEKQLSDHESLIALYESANKELDAITPRMSLPGEVHYKNTVSRHRRSLAKARAQRDYPLRYSDI